MSTRAPIDDPLTESRVREIVREEIEWALKIGARPAQQPALSYAAQRKLARDEAIAADYDAGMNMGACAAKHGVCAATVAAALKRVGMVKPPRPPKSRTVNKVARAERDAAIAAMYLEGNSTLEKTAIAHGCSIGTVVNTLDRLGIPHHGCQRKDPASDPRLPRFKEMRAAGATLTEIGAEHHLTRERVRQIFSRAGIDTSERPLTGEQIAAVEEYMASGGNITFFAARFGVGEATFKSWVVRAGHVPKKKARKGSDAAKARSARVAQLYADGWTAQQIADEVGLRHQEDVYRDLARAGVKPSRVRAVRQAA